MSVALVIFVLWWPHIFYAWVWLAPKSFMNVGKKVFPGMDPVDLFAWGAHFFKVIQFLVFGWWLLSHDAQAPGILAAILGLALAAGGQVLNVSAYQAIGKAGIYYGFKLGHTVPWCHGFPFNFIAHPQYVGATMTVWGLAFLLGSGAWASGLATVTIGWSGAYVFSGVVEQCLGHVSLD